MYARVTTITTPADRVDEAIRIYQDSVVPVLKQQPGYRSTLLLNDRASGKGVAISVWETQQDLQASEASGFYQEQLAKFAPLLSAPPVREVFELAVSA